MPRPVSCKAYSRKERVMEKVGILYVCTGRYAVFWDSFYRSCEEKFLTDVEKHYFLFTDSENLLRLETERVHTVRQEAEPWPFPTLHRFSYFLKAESALRKMDYLMFMNANLLVMQEVHAAEILPEGDEKLFVTIHPGFFDRLPRDFTYDRNPDCSACVPLEEGSSYFSGAFNGGCADDFLALARCLSQRTEADYARNVIALWHDESHLNRYMIDYPGKFRVLSPAYLYPQDWKLPFDRKIQMRDKSKWGGHSFLRSET